MSKYCTSLLVLRNIRYKRKVNVSNVRCVRAVNRAWEVEVALHNVLKRILRKHCSDPPPYCKIKKQHLNPLYP